MYSFKTDPLTGKVMPILEDKKNHTIDSLRYACEGARRAVVTDLSAFHRPVRQGVSSWMA
jgi:phage terminase large subunit